jgi:PIN domain nuclease of toxin-antitoxin system
MLLTHGIQVEGSELPEWNSTNHHRDPVDRMLAAQAQLENMPILTSDTQIAQYPVKTIW